MIRTQIQLTEKQAKLLKDMAKAKNVSVSELIRQSIGLLLKK
jgi:16S rRNA U516 pseudouridylate synthase RsuA-like enzyme